MNDAVLRLAKWYEAQCNGSWEHEYGVVIDTLDNPGWSVKVDLTGTNLAGSQFVEVKNLAHERNWIHCVVKEQRFEGTGGPGMLGHILEVFLSWASKVESAG
jgi:hypothetical protein